MPRRSRRRRRRSAHRSRGPDPDPLHLVLRQAQYAADPVAREMRLLRPGPQGGSVGPRVDDGAGWAHAGMRLERPFVFRFDDPRGTGEGRVDLARRERHLALEDGRLTHVVVKYGHLRKGRRCLGPGDPEPLGRLHRVPFALGDDADEPLVADHSNAPNVVHRAFIDGDGHSTRNRRPDHAAVQHPRHLDVGDVIERAEDLVWDVETWWRLADDLVGAG